jgi:hypothetical protein
MSDETSEASSFRLLFNSESPGRAVLEFDTDRHPVRVLLTQDQLDRLSTEGVLARLDCGGSKEEAQSAAGVAGTPSYSVRCADPSAREPSAAPPNDW